MLRRISLVSVGIFIQNPDYMIVQWIIVMLVIIIGPQIIILKLNANKSLFENRLELFNEYFCGVLAILFCIFTPHYELDLHQKAGWAVI